MKMSYRDKVILLSIVVIFVWVIGVMFFIKPKFEDLDKANTELDEKILTLNKKQEEIAADEGLEDRVKEAYKNVTNIANNFYDKMTTDEVSTLIDTKLDEVKITNDSMKLSQYSSATLATINASPIEAATEIDRIATKKLVDNNVVEVTEESSNNGPVTVPAYNINFGYNCKLSDLQEFLEKLRTNNQKSLVVTACTIDDINESTISGSMTLVLMMMPRMQNPLEVNNQTDTSSAAATDTSSAAESEAS